jgi:hypothetical protein
MLSLPKKNPDKAAAASTPAWHPNFRNFAQLPDTKHVRTSFFVNGVAVVVAGIFLLLFVYQEYRLAESRQQLKNWEQQIERDRPNSAKAVALFKKFQDEEKKIKELANFLGNPPIRTSDLLLRLGATLPSDVTIDLIDCSEKEIIIRASLKGTGDQATAAASSYQARLKNDPVFSPIFTVDTTNLARDTENQRMILDLSLKFKPEAKKP